MPELEWYITHGKEERNLEYKATMKWDDREIRGMITKTILGMSNIRYGGTIVVGVEQRGQEFVPVGMNPSDLESFKQDDVARHVANYAAPYVQFYINRCVVDEKIFIVIEVMEFDEIPVICRRKWDGRRVRMREGAVYTRTHGALPQTSEVSSYEEMREIISLAVDKGVERELSRLRRLGLLELTTKEPEDTDRRRYDEELRGL